MNNKITLGAKMLVSEFKERKYHIEFLSIDSSFIKISKNDKNIIIKSSIFPVDLALSAFIAKNKMYTHYFCKKNNVPVPKQKMCVSLKQVKMVAKIIKFPLVIKPINLAYGEGIVVNIKNITDLLSESKIALEKYEKILVEKYIRGRDHRLLIVDGKFASAVLRIPATVKGDGKNSIKKLINIENKNPLRGKDYTKPLLTIKIDEETERLLIKNGYTLDEIPKKGEIIYLKETSNASKGGETEVITSRVHESYIKLAEKATRIIGLKYAGVDIVTEDISKDNYGNLGKVIEVNSFPGIDIHQYPSRGKGDNVGKVIVDMIEKYCF